jgi:hypothetical protein
MNIDEFLQKDYNKEKWTRTEDWCLEGSSEADGPKFFAGWVCFTKEYEINGVEKTYVKIEVLFWFHVQVYLLTGRKHFLMKKEQPLT